MTGKGQPASGGFAVVEIPGGRIELLIIVYIKEIYILFNEQSVTLLRFDKTMSVDKPVISGVENERKAAVSMVASENPSATYMKRLAARILGRK